MYCFEFEVVLLNGNIIAKINDAIVGKLMISKRNFILSYKSVFLFYAFEYHYK